VYDAAVVDAAQCMGCGDRHFANELNCPRTKRSVREGPFGSIVGHYRVGQLLGAGGFGAVHVAEDTRTGATVALKLLHPELVTEREMLVRFITEAEVTVRAGNPHIVRVLEASFSDKSVYVALEMLEGQTLANEMRGGPMPPERAVDIAIQMLDGLAVAHAAGVIHRDIKPANVFLTDDPDAPKSLVKILDFGIGRMMVSKQNQRLTRTGAQLGTPHFMAPEQVTDSKRADARADLYAVGVTLYAMLTCERPYGNVSVGEWVGLITRGVAATRATSQLGRLPPLLVEVIAIALSIDPAQRFQDAGAFARALLDSMPDSHAVTRSLPALAVTETFLRAGRPPSAPVIETIPTTKGPARPSERPNGGGPPREAERESVAAPTRPPRQASSLVLAAGALLVLALALSGAVVVGGAVVYGRGAVARGGAADAPSGVSLAPVRHPTGAAPRAAESTAAVPEAVPGASAPLMPPGLGVHFADPMGDEDAVDFATVRAVIQSDLRRFERCRVAGRPTRARVYLQFDDSGALSDFGPIDAPTYDVAASRCIGARFSEAAAGVRFGADLTMVFLTADLDAS